MKHNEEKKEFEPVEVESTPKLTVAIKLIQEKVCQSTGLTPDELKGRTIIINKDSIVIK